MVAADGNGITREVFASAEVKEWPVGSERRSETVIESVYGHKDSSFQIRRRDTWRDLGDGYRWDRQFIISSNGNVGMVGTYQLAILQDMIERVMHESKEAIGKYGIEVYANKTVKD
jgi:hypothetical protein